MISFIIDITYIIIFINWLKQIDLDNFDYGAHYRNMFDNKNDNMN